VHMNSNDNTHIRRDTPAARRAGTVMTGLVVAAALISACAGGSKNPGVANLGSTSSTTAAPAVSLGGGDSGRGPADPAFQEQQLKFARCMQAHGITNFPDSGGISINSGIDPNSAQFQAAQRACQSLLPGLAQTPSQKAAANTAALEFAQCMRSHGIPNFPDPNGQGVIDMTGVNIRLDSPQNRNAMQACQALDNGFMMFQGNPGNPSGTPTK
jgi:hypothetical protein